jgi:hypothetical protein
MIERAFHRPQPIMFFAYAVKGETNPEIGLRAFFKHFFCVRDNPLGQYAVGWDGDVLDLVAIMEYLTNLWQVVSKKWFAATQCDILELGEFLGKRSNFIEL